MSIVRPLLTFLILLAGFSTAAVRAETFHTCGTIIASLPTVITTAGVYCLSHDVNTAISSGNAIAINANNVTLDCNGYKIGGLAAGTGSMTNGIYSDSSRQNITVRNCTIRGFKEGILLSGGAGHLVEDNRLDNNLFIGIDVGGDNNRVRRNAVYDTGGYPSSVSSVGIYAQADVSDNTVAGVFATATDSNAYGVMMFNPGTEARGNQIRGLVATGTGLAEGIDVFGASVTVRNNTIVAAPLTTGYGVDGTVKSFCTGNTISNFSTPIALCQDAGGNASN